MGSVDTTGTWSPVPGSNICLLQMPVVTTAAATQPLGVKFWSYQFPPVPGGAVPEQLGKVPVSCCWWTWVLLPSLKT